MKIKIHPYIFIILGLLQITTNCISQTTINETVADSILTSFVTQELVVGGAAGISINGKTVWSEAAGLMDEENGKAFDLNTLTRIASIAKPITAVAAMQMVEKGKLDLDKSIQTYLPDYPISTQGDITPRHLITHTSGIAGYESNKEAQSNDNFPSLKEACTVFQDRKLLFPPGTQYSYTSYGYVVLGRIIEAASGISYGEYVQKYIFDMAGMDDSGIEIYGNNYPNKSTLYHRNKKGKIQNPKANNLSNRIPGGGFYSTVPDILAFGNAVLDGTLISEESRNAMFTDGGVRHKDAGNPYAKGWFLYGQNPTYGTVIGHSGEQTGCSAQLMILPDINAVVIILTNTSGTWIEVVNGSVALIHCMKTTASPD